MDRELSTKSSRERAIPGQAPDFELLPSRRAGLEVIRAALAEAGGPVVLTGEPGVGKSTLRRSLEAERSSGSRWVNVEVTPGTGVDPFYALIRHGLGLEPGPIDRPTLADFLEESSLDTLRWTLAIDEAQNLDAAILEEIRVLSNRLGEPSGFDAILLVGQTPLARRLSGRALDGLAARVAAHVHLRPLDADEVGMLLQTLEPDREWPIALVDQIHLLSGGRPARVRALASGPRSGRRTPRLAVEAVATPAPSSTGTSYPEPLVGPSKPPILVEDGLIEVGWQPGQDDSAVDDDGDSTSTTIEGEERINDHYAALQAWQEWATNQGRHSEVLEPEALDATEEPDPDSPLATTPNLWADEEHGFAPIGRLFTRLKHETEAE